MKIFFFQLTNSAQAEESTSGTECVDCQIDQLNSERDFFGEQIAKTETTSTQNHHLFASHHSKKELSSELGLEKDKNLFMFADKKPIIIKGDQFSRNALCINY